jgi:TRAP-type C4-dicarboxylate transport system substrate-binding protein
VGAQLGSFTLTYSISENTWDTLPGDIQEALFEASRDTNRHLCAALNKKNEATRSEMEQQGTGFTFPARRTREQWRNAVQPVRDRWAEDMKNQALPEKEAIQAMSEVVEMVLKK